MQDSEEFDDFLKNVDQISELVKELSSADTSNHARAVERADSWLDARKGGKSQNGPVNRTVINSNPSVPEPAATGTGPSSGPRSSQEAFMKVLEKDAEERGRRRRAKEEKANALKTRGNAAFTQGDYQAAVQLYSQGLEQLRDMQELYTNRAQALIKLQRYTEAVLDCEWALKCNEKNIKAYVHMGRAHLSLHDHAKARQCFEKVVELEPQQREMVKGYVSQVDLAERRAQEERRAREEYQKEQEEAVSTATGQLLQLLRKLEEPGETSLYYCGGMELLSLAITDCNGQTMFRLHRGFSIINDNTTILRCLQKDSQEPCAGDVCVTVLKLWKVVCQENDTNQQLLMEWACVRECVVCLLALPWVAVQRECVSLLVSFSHTPHGRSLLLDNLDLHMLVEHLMKCLLSVGDLETVVLSLLESLAQEKKFCQRIRDVLSSIVAPFTSMLKSTCDQNQSTLPLYMLVIGHLTHDPVIRKTLSNSLDCWEAFLVAMEQSISCEHRDILYPLLGLMINVSSEHSPAIQVCAGVCSRRCCALLTDPNGGIITRAVGLLSRLLPQSAAALEEAVQAGVVKNLLRILKVPGQDSTKYAMRALAQCTEVSLDARLQLTSLDKKLRVLRLLVCEGEECVAGNAALCLGQCVSVPGVARRLLDTDCVMVLLRHAAADANTNTSGNSLQRNAAIALARLCQAENRHLVKLRELHGLEILHSCMQLIT